jgi:drug/metabolite transporter (DMT)-like permease
MSHLNRQERIGTGLATGSMLLVGGSVAASSLLDGYPVLGGQGIRYLVAALLLAAWAQLRRKPQPPPDGISTPALYPAAFDRHVRTTRRRRPRAQGAGGARSGVSRLLCC